MDSSSSKVAVRLLAHLALPPSMEYANVHQELSLKVNASPAAARVSLQSAMFVSLATPTALSVKAILVLVHLASPVTQLTLLHLLAFQPLNALMVSSIAMEYVLLFVKMHSSSMRVFAFMEVASADIKPTLSEVA